MATSQNSGPLIYVGTSGWLYSWNPRGSLDWYVEHSGLNAVELNASFYRFPRPGQVESWAKRGRRLRWAVKIHRSVTHIYRLNEKALEAWNRFHRLFQPLEELVDFYLLQLPPSYRPEKRYMERLEWFAAQAGLGERLAVEFRHREWFRERLGVRVCEKIGATFVSVDSPIGVYIDRSSDSIYLRMHGRTAWYSHYYTDRELLEDAKKILGLNPDRVYVFFNNNHDMLENARRMLTILRNLARETGEPETAPK